MTLSIEIFEIDCVVAVGDDGGDVQIGGRGPRKLSTSPTLKRGQGRVLERTFDLRLVCKLHIKLAPRLPYLDHPATGERSIFNLD